MTERQQKQMARNEYLRAYRENHRAEQKGYIGG